LEKVSDNLLNCFSPNYNQTVLFVLYFCSLHQHRARETELRDPYGWLSLCGLHEPPASFSFKDQIVVVSATKGSDEEVQYVLAVNGETKQLDVDVPVHIAGDATATLIKRFGKHVVRLRDPQAPSRTDFKGLTCCEISFLFLTSEKKG
jgi:uncharacterized protein (DUF1684 family)